MQLVSAPSESTMPEPADSVHSPVSHGAHAPNHPLAGWLGAVSLVALFGVALYFYPPLTDASKAIEVPQWVKFFGRLHIVVLHLPVALLLFAAIKEVLIMCRHRASRVLAHASTFTLEIAAWGAVIAVIFGIFLSRKGNLHNGEFYAHQALGIATAVGAILSLIIKLLVDARGKFHGLYRTVLAVTLVVMLVGAHLGGNLVYGSDHLIKYAPAPVHDGWSRFESMLVSWFEPENPGRGQPKDRDDEPPPPAVAEPHGAASGPSPGKASPAALAAEPSGTATVYADVVAPILQAKCTSCHDEEKSKADLRLDTYALMMEGNDNGPVIVPGQPEHSALITCMELPVDDDEHMPPEKKEQMTPEEIALIRWWIQEGASDSMKVKDAKFPPETQSLVDQLVSRKTAASSRPQPVSLMRRAAASVLTAAISLAVQAAEPAGVPPDAALTQAIEKVNASGASLMPISADAKAYRFTALNVAKEFTDANLAPLAAIADKIASLDLARTKITDTGLKAVAAMAHLKELHLENTAISDAGLDHLKSLSELEYLNLYNTKVTDAGAQKLAGLVKLKSLYLWQTGVTKAGVAQLKQKLPGAHINIGWSAEDDAKPVVAPAVATAASAKPGAPSAPKPAPAPTPAAAKPAANTSASASATPTAAAKLDPAIAAKAVVYKDIVVPILAEKCVGCHGTEKKKGKLQMHDYAAILKGGSDGPNTVVAGKPADSLMIQRILLPLDDDEHMPPEDEKQITKEECQILSWWIENGASETLTVAAAKKTPAIEGVLAALLAKGLPKAASPAVAKAEKEKPKPLTDAEKKQVAEIAAKMQALNASLMQLAQDTEQLRLSVINAADKFGDKELVLLEPIASQVVWVDLARSQVSDAGLDVIAKMTSLERLHLENTKVTDAGVTKLANLQQLEYLNLYGTKTTDAGLSKLETAKGLKKVFVWQTGVTQAGAKALEGKLPGLKVNTGLTEAEIAKLTAPPPAPPPAPEAKKEETKPATAKPPPAAAKPAQTPPPAAAAKKETPKQLPPPAAKPAPPPAAPAPAKPAAPPATQTPPPAQPKKA